MDNKHFRWNTEERHFSTPQSGRDEEKIAHFSDYQLRKMLWQSVDGYVSWKNLL